MTPGDVTQLPTAPRFADAASSGSRDVAGSANEDGSSANRSAANRSAPSPSPSERWQEAREAICLFAVDPTIGLRLRSRAGFVRDRLMAELRGLLPFDCSVRRMPIGCDGAALVGSLDLGATLAAGSPIFERGLIERSHGGILIATMAERMSRTAEGELVAVLDTGRLRIERDGVSREAPASVGLVAFDEGSQTDEAPPAAILDRLGLVVELDGADPRQEDEFPIDRETIAAARAHLGSVGTGARPTELLCQAAEALGVRSLRASIHALKVARAAAALLGEETIGEEAIEMAIRHVLGPRATRIPELAEALPEESEGQPAPPDDAANAPDQTDDTTREEDRGSQTAPESGSGSGEIGQTDGSDKGEQSAPAQPADLPADLLAKLAAMARPTAGRADAGRAGGSMRSAERGRVVGTSEGDPRQAPLDLIATLTAAAPWQRLRREEAISRDRSAKNGRVILRSSDFRVRRLEAKRETATIFCVDASGSAALARLAEAKGAVELILAECYVRRDRVALVAFRGTKAEVLLPETKSLTRAKRALSSFPAGGGTPLAAGIAAALGLARAAQRDGRTPLIALLTDGRANIGADGLAGRKAARRDAETAARSVRTSGFASLTIDTAQRAGPAAREIADAMGGRYLALPRTDAKALSRALAKTGPTR